MDPAYLRIESSLLTAIDSMPKLEKPDTSKPRLFNLRIYESHNERAGKKKIEMFNKTELAIFKHDGLTPVFFGETILGSAMPNLTYMLVFPDDAARKAAWGKFVARSPTGSNVKRALARIRRQGDCFPHHQQAADAGGVFGDLDEAHMSSPKGCAASVDLPSTFGRNRFAGTLTRSVSEGALFLAYASG